MTFRNIVLLFFTVLVLSSCKGLQYYKSGTNPAGLSVVLTCPSQFYTNAPGPDSLGFYLVNHNSKQVVVPHWWTDLYLVGQSRFYKKESWIRPQPLDLDLALAPLTIQPGDTVHLITVALKNLLQHEKNWLYKNQPVWGPHLLSAKKYHPYIYLTAAFKTQVPNQADFIQIRSQQHQLNLTTFKEIQAENKKTLLALSSDVKNYSPESGLGNLFCKITNMGAYPIPLFNDPGSVRFKLYAYNPNRTATLFTQYVLDNGQLPVSPVTIQSQQNFTLTIPLQQILFISPSVKSIYYWSWNKNTPPVSPLVYGKNSRVQEVEFWFGVVVDGKEYLSNTLHLDILQPIKKNKK
jgi:hypothetical protein